MTSPVECAVPSGSVLQPQWVMAAYYQDAFRVPLTPPPAGVVDIFFGIFGHHPAWIRWTLVTRNVLARWSGLAVARRADVLAPARQSAYAVGDTIGPWPLLSLDDRELIAGRDNPHLDFRLSVYRETGGPSPHAVVSTVCVVHHWTGKAYLFLIVPFHRWGLRYILRRALRAGRL